MARDLARNRRTSEYDVYRTMRLDVNGMNPELARMAHRNYRRTAAAASASAASSAYDLYRNLIRLDIDGMSPERLLPLGERVGSHRGIPQEMISVCLNEKVFADHEQERSCVICLEEFQIGEAVSALIKCGHEYHAPCITRWLLSKKTCPMCRSAAL